MKLYTLMIVLTSMVILFGSPSWAQSCPGCSNVCGPLCLDGRMCSDGQQMECVGGTEPYCPTTPIIIDTRSEGFHLTNIANGVKFTFGVIRLQTSWTDARYSNAWLALDRDGDGRIENATELFGEMTPQPASDSPNGYKALAVFDEVRNGGNGNGKIDPGDAIWPSLRLWIDRNHNGVSEPRELITLTEAGIFAIDLDYTVTHTTDQYGNTFRYAAGVEDKYNNRNPLCYDVILMTTPPGPTTLKPSDEEQ